MTAQHKPAEQPAMRLKTAEELARSAKPAEQCIHIENKYGLCMKCGERMDPAEHGRGEAGEMDAKRATFFLERFKRDEKMLGPNEQAALDFAIAALTQPKVPLYVLDAVDALNRADLWDHANNLERYFGLPTAALSLPRQSEAGYSEKFRASGDWSRFPIGTRAYSTNGGHWERVPSGWKWCTGSTFPTPGADAFDVAVPTTPPAAQGDEPK